MVLLFCHWKSNLAAGLNILTLRHSWAQGLLLMAQVYDEVRGGYPY